jgi:hypothetical protein
VQRNRRARFEFRLSSGLFVTIAALSVHASRPGAGGANHVSQWEYLHEPESDAAVDLLVAALSLVSANRQAANR